MKQETMKLFVLAFASAGHAATPEQASMLQSSKSLHEQLRAVMVADTAEITAPESVGEDALITLGVDIAETQERPFKCECNIRSDYASENLLLTEEHVWLRPGHTEARWSDGEVIAGRVGGYALTKNGFLASGITDVNSCWSFQVDLTLSVDMSHGNSMHKPQFDVFETIHGGGKGSFGFTTFYPAGLFNDGKKYGYNHGDREWIIDYPSTGCGWYPSANKRCLVDEMRNLIEAGSTFTYFFERLEGGKFRVQLKSGPADAVEGTDAVFQATSKEPVTFTDDADHWPFGFEYQYQTDANSKLKRIRRVGLQSSVI